MKRNNLLRWIALLVLLLLPVSAAAAQTGSLLITGISYPVSLYQVGDDQGHYTPAFVNCGLPPAINDLEEAAAHLDAYVRSSQISGWEKSPRGGEVSYGPLNEGLYLVRSLHPKIEFSSFLLIMPTTLNGEAIYHITAAPKINEIPPETEETEPSEPVTQPTETTVPTETTTETTAPSGSTPPTDATTPAPGVTLTPQSDAHKIPQTGNSVIPKYALLILGTLFTLTGLFQVLTVTEESSDD